MSYRDDMRRWRQAVKVAREAGMPPPARPDPPRSSPARQRPQRRSFESIAESLFGKLISGTEIPGQGIIPYAMLPEAARKQIQLTAPPVGWDPSQLDSAERALLSRLITVGRAENPSSTLTPEQETALARRMISTQRSVRRDDIRRMTAKPWQRGE